MMRRGAGFNADQAWRQLLEEDRDQRRRTAGVALIAGVFILVMPRLLNLVVAIYLIIVGLMGLNAIYHWVQ
jgi:Protein of unknown function (DUF3096)